VLETPNSLGKFAQLYNVFIYDLVTTMKLCQVDLHKLYVGLIVASNDDFFGNFMGWWKPTMMTYESSGSQILTLGLITWGLSSMVNMYGQNMKTWRLGLVHL